MLARPPTLVTEPLIEFGSPVTLPFRGEQIPALRDINSGYVLFPPPEPDVLAAYYRDEYAQSQSGYYTVETDYNPDKNCHHADHVLRVFQNLTGRKPRSAAELGCSYGGMVAEMVSRGIETRGFDINEGAIRAGRDVARNTRIAHATNLAALDNVSNTDLIYSLHVLEHDPDLIEVVAKCRDALSPDGLLFLSVPNAMYIQAVLGGLKAHYWTNYPQHLHMLSAGFIPALCAATGMIPMAWSTGIFFNVDPTLAAQFAPDALTQPKRGAWETLLGTAGHGMELVMALAPNGRAPEAVLSSLEGARQRELAIRAYLRDARCAAPA